MLASIVPSLTTRSGPGVRGDRPFGLQDVIADDFVHERAFGESLEPVVPP